MAERVSALELRRLRFRAQLSTLEIRKQQAVCVRNAYKHYGTKINPVNVLEDLCMTVPKGCIYGLLGASGCGKTTLVNCIVGRKRLNSGEIWVLGGSPDSKDSGVPGPRIGYMPQHICLYGEFTIRETVKYFGWITGMSNEKIQKRLEFLVKLLNLPPADRLVKDLSGGQQRRVSFLVALLHEPELLILDEPTVGLDPILRETIWKFLLEITKTGQTTVILTTHYIDEMRNAHYIGLMRGGYILDEESPESLLNRCNTTTLEEAFLKLSVVQNLGRRRRSSIAQGVTSGITLPSGIINQTAILEDTEPNDGTEISGEFGDSISGSTSNRRVSIITVNDDPLTKLPSEESSASKTFYNLLDIKSNRIKAILWKNILWFLRNVPILLTLFGLPAALISLFCIAIGHEPVNLPVAVVNHETNKVSCETVLSCDNAELSCVYLEYLQKRALNLIYYDSEQEARESVIHGDTFASIVVKHNYTAALKTRIANWDRQNNWDIIYSTVEVFRDVAIRDIAFFMRMYLYEGLETFLADYLVSCGIKSEVLTPPVKFELPVYGLLKPHYSDFMTPGIVLTTAFFMALALTAVAMLTERNEGILERSLVVGVKPIEVLTAHIVCDSVLVVGQIAVILISAFGIFKMTMVGSLSLVTLLTLMTGLCGMCVGFAISCVCDNELMATMTVGGIFLPVFLLSGLIWPIEGMHYILQHVSIILPFTKASESMRNILQRGWGLSEPSVYEGFVSISVWIIVSLIISMLCLKFKKG